MDKFKALFGIEAKEIQKACILTPFFRTDWLGDFGVREIKRGKIYGSGQGKDFTLLQVGIGASLAGDCVLHLKDTSCEKILFFGSCGLLKSLENIKMHDLVTPGKALALESFTNLFTKSEIDWTEIFPDQNLFMNFLHLGIKNVVCATLGSLVFEEENFEVLDEDGIEVLDMECSAVFTAARLINKPAASLLYVTDIVHEKPFYRILNECEKETLDRTIKQGIKILRDIASI